MLEECQLALARFLESERGRASPQAPIACHIEAAGDLWPDLATEAMALYSNAAGLL